MLNREVESVGAQSDFKGGGSMMGMEGCAYAEGWVEEEETHDRNILRFPALIKDGWIITNDPLYIRISEAVKVQIDLAAESAIAAVRGSEKIAVEIKSFIAGSDINEFHTALGQYLIELTHCTKRLDPCITWAIATGSIVCICGSIALRQQNA